MPAYKTKSDIVRELRKAGNLYGAVISKHDAPYMQLVKSDVLKAFIASDAEDLEDEWSLRVDKYGNKFLNPAE